MTLGRESQQQHRNQRVQLHDAAMVAAPITAVAATATPAT